MIVTRHFAASRIIDLRERARTCLCVCGLDEGLVKCCIYLFHIDFIFGFTGSRSHTLISEHSKGARQKEKEREGGADY